MKCIINSLLASRGKLVTIEVFANGVCIKDIDLSIDDDWCFSNLAPGVFNDMFIYQLHAIAAGMGIKNAVISLAVDSVHFRVVRQPSVCHYDVSAIEYCREALLDPISNFKRLVSSIKRITAGCTEEAHSFIFSSCIAHRLAEA